MPDNTLINQATTPGQTIATKDIGGVNHELVILEYSDGGGATEVSAASPLPVTDAAVLAKLSSDPATQTTLAALLNKVIAAPSTEAKQDIMVTGLAAILTKIIAAPATEAKQDSQTVLLTTLNSLIETNNSLISLLAPLASAMNSGQPALRVNPIASVSTAVTGSVTATVASTVISGITAIGGISAYPFTVAQLNLLPVSNINNANG